MQLCRSQHVFLHRLETLLSSLQEAQGREDQHLENLKELESLLVRRRNELDRLNTEVITLFEEVFVYCLLFIYKPFDGGSFSWDYELI